MKTVCGKDGFDEGGQATDLLGRLKKWFTWESWICTVLEIAAGAGFAALLGAEVSGQGNTVVLVVCGVVYFPLLIQRIRHKALFPVAILEELEAKISLGQKKKQLARRDDVLRFITDSITELNAQTCSIAGSRWGGERVCQGKVDEGLRKVLGAMIEHPQYILDCNESQFSVACFVKYWSPKEETGLVEEKHAWVIFRDDHQISGFLTEDLIDAKDATGARFDLHKSIQSCRNNNRLVTARFSPREGELTIVASPIPAVCEQLAAEGVLLCVTRCGGALPSDIEETLRIFGRILTNWLEKYSDCVVAQTDGQLQRERWQQDEGVRLTPGREPPPLAESSGSGT